MGNINERLKAYHKQAKKWSNNYEMVLAKDVLVMIEEFQGDLEDVVKRLEEEMQLADEEKRKCSPLQFDFHKGYAQAMYVAIQIVKGRESDG